MKICLNCDKEFTCKWETRTKYCSKKCAKEIEKKRQYSTAPGKPQGLTCGTLGAFSELIASADLISKGYEVFRAISPSCSCDLIALKNGTSLRFEVRTGHLNRNGQANWPKARFKSDHFAVVIGKDVIYFPEL